MVVNGCLLDEAYGDYHKKEKKKNNKKEVDDIDRDYKESGNINPNEEGSSFYPVNEMYYHPHRGVEVPKHPPTQPRAGVSRSEEEKIDKENNRFLTDKDYQDYLNFQRNRHNYIHQKDIIETFSTVDDNFNDVLIFALFGMMFLIFTDYIYKLGKKSY